MISYPCGRSCAGKSSGWSLSHPDTGRAEIDESIHVSRTSASPLNSFAPHSQASGGCVRVGSSGSHSSFATFVFPHPEQYHAGIGVANILCLEMHQSHSIVPVQFSSRTFI